VRILSATCFSNRTLVIIANSFSDGCVMRLGKMHKLVLSMLESVGLLVLVLRAKLARKT
jgi:hypothetical protein